ncbi:hypothetical protein RJ640_024911 [Escallonia rubra]|uniref:ADP-ribosyl cyclase/cyclic ADP-ribose hydrolase n=1 Tax=Escallonia rubra TaxID=112253 RepID=A0AA88UMP4_9ASTE|nr:hypothetical protein RJ640_024911 [Escallonia rubra]
MAKEFDVVSSKRPLLFMAAAGGQEAISSTSQYTSTSAYDVFLSFRGEDIRKTFLDHLYTALVGAGFHTFRDADEIERAENIKLELEQAIQQSRSSIVVFSENYASSKWCLDELVMIVERRRRTSQFVLLPVFYHVDPSHVRNQTGSLAAAFAGHEEWFAKERIQGWREALREVAELAGMVLLNQADGFNEELIGVSKAFDASMSNLLSSSLVYLAWLIKIPSLLSFIIIMNCRHEAKFIKKIVKVIKNRVNRRALDLPSTLVGIDSRVKDINLWLHNGSRDVGIMLLCGMGGIGKTTIARYVFNLNFSRFDSSSFLANIRESFEKPDGLIRLQRQLLADISKGNMTEIFSVDDGINKIKFAMSRQRVLLVFDDVDQEEQLQAILGMQDWFYPSSKVIITTRNVRLLTARASKYEILNVDKLDSNESLELFSMHAFGHNRPNEPFVQLSENVVRQCEGLPLALEILGSSLYGRSIDLWQSAIEKLQAIPNNQILRKLRISYDSLEDRHDRDLFLEVACFFVGEDKDHVVTILDQCEFHTRIGVQNLTDRCLLRVDRYNKIMMHEMLRALGREITCEQSRNPGSRSRLWRHKDSFSVLKNNSATVEIEGLALDMHMLLKRDERVSCINSARPGRIGFFSWPVANSTFNISDEMDLKADAFSTMSRLRLLHINYLHLTGGFKGFPKEIKWLRWHGCPLEYIPSDFPLESPVAIDMSYSNLKTGWCGTKRLGCLKILDLGNCHGLTSTPDFSRLRALERLILKKCTSLIEVHASIENLENSLLYLNLEDCISLSKLPGEIGKLKVLNTLIISGCSNLEEFPMEIERLQALQVFHADRIVMGTIHPTTSVYSSWHAFVRMRTWVSKPRKTLEVSWASLPCSLVDLSLAGCNLFDDAIPSELGNLLSLQNLNLGRNPISCVPTCIKGLTRLQRLNLENCPRLQSVTGIRVLEEINLYNCKSLQKYESETPSCNIVECNNLVEMTLCFKLIPIDDTRVAFVKNQLEPMNNIEMKTYHIATKTTRRGPIQVLFEGCGLLSTFYPGNQVPAWFRTRIRGSSLSFTVPSSPHTSTGGISMCLCFVYSMKEQDHEQFYAIVSNETKDLKLIYGPSCYGCPKADEDMSWVSYWMLGNDKLEADDEITISLLSTKAVEVREIGFHLVHLDLGAEADTVEVKQPAYPSWDSYPEECEGRSGSTRLFGQGTLRFSVKDLLKDVGVTWDPCQAEFRLFTLPASHVHSRSAGDQNL